MHLTIKQLKQIIKEEVQNFLGEDRKGNKIIGYHATITGGDFSNVLGWKQVSGGKSAEMATDQGGGFYMFANKNRALRRLKSSHAVPDDWGGGMSYRKMEPEDGYGMIVTLEVPYSFKHLEIDYEISYDVWVDFVTTYMDRFLSLTLSNGQQIFDSYDESKKEIIVKAPYNTKSQLGRSIVLDKTTGNKLMYGNVMSRILRFMEKGLFGAAARGVHQEFEEQLIEKAPAFKYNGDDVTPIKLEVVKDGQLIDVTQEVMSGDIELIKSKVESNVSV